MPPVQSDFQITDTPLSAIAFHVQKLINDRYPDLKNLVKGFDENLADDVLAELQSVAEYVDVMGDKIILEFIHNRGEITGGILKKNSDSFKKVWESSALKDNVIQELLDRVLKGLNIFEPAVTKYLILQHMVKRLEIDNGGHTELERTVVRENLEASEISTNFEKLYKISLINFLDQIADNIQEMNKIYRLYRFQNDKIEELEKFQTNVVLDLDISQNPKKFGEVKKFIFDNWRGFRLRVFSFVLWFSRSDRANLREVLRANMNRISSVFKDVTSSEDYINFQANPKMFIEKDFNEYLRELIEA